MEQNLLVFAHLYRVPAGERQPAIDRALGMATSRRPPRLAQVAELSGGMRRRLLIARALLHSRAWCCSTSRPSASIRRSARSSGR